MSITNDLLYKTLHYEKTSLNTTKVKLFGISDSNNFRVGCHLKGSATSGSFSLYFVIDDKKTYSIGYGNRNNNTTVSLYIENNDIYIESNEMISSISTKLEVFYGSLNGSMISEYTGNGGDKIFDYDFSSTEQIGSMTVVGTYKVNDSASTNILSVKDKTTARTLDINTNATTNSINVSDITETNSLTVSNNISLTGSTSVLTVNTNATTNSINISGSTTAKNISVANNMTANNVIANNIQANNVNIESEGSFKTLTVNTNATTNSINISGSTTAKNVNISENITSGSLNVANLLETNSLTVSNNISLTGSTSTLTVNTNATTNSINVSDITETKKLNVSNNISLTGSTSTLTVNTNATTNSINISGSTTAKNVNAINISTNSLNVNNNLDTETFEATNVISNGETTVANITTDSLNSKNINSNLINVTGKTTLSDIRDDGENYGSLIFGNNEKSVKGILTEAYSILSPTEEELNSQESSSNIVPLNENILKRTIRLFNCDEKLLVRTESSNTIINPIIFATYSKTINENASSIREIDNLNGDKTHSIKTIFGQNNVNISNLTSDTILEPALDILLSYGIAVFVYVSEYNVSSDGKTITPKKVNILYRRYDDNTQGSDYYEHVDVYSSEKGWEYQTILLSENLIKTDNSEAEKNMFVSYYGPAEKAEGSEARSIALLSVAVTDSNETKNYSLITGEILTELLNSEGKIMSSGMASNLNKTGPENTLIYQANEKSTQLVPNIDTGKVFNSTSSGKGTKYIVTKTFNGVGNEIPEYGLELYGASSVNVNNSRDTNHDYEERIPTVGYTNKLVRSYKSIRYNGTISYKKNDSNVYSLDYTTATTLPKAVGDMYIFTNKSGDNIETISINLSDGSYIFNNNNLSGSGFISIGDIVIIDSINSPENPKYRIINLNRNKTTDNKVTYIANNYITENKDKNIVISDDGYSIHKVSTVTINPNTGRIKSKIIDTETTYTGSIGSTSSTPVKFISNVSLDSALSLNAVNIYGKNIASADGGPLLVNGLNIAKINTASDISASDISNINSITASTFNVETMTATTKINAENISTDSITASTAEVTSDIKEGGSYLKDKYLGIDATSDGAKTILTSKTSKDKVYLISVEQEDENVKQTPLTDSNLYYDANTNTLTTSTFSGKLSGNATSATKVSVNKPENGTLYLLGSNVDSVDNPITPNFNSELKYDISSKTLTASNFSGIASSATVATSLSTATAGSTNLPVYFSGGKPVETSTTLSVCINGNATTATKLSASKNIKLKSSSNTSASNTETTTSTDFNSSDIDLILPTSVAFNRVTSEIVNVNGTLTANDLVVQGTFVTKATEESTVSIDDSIIEIGAARSDSGNVIETGNKNIGIYSHIFNTDSGSKIKIANVPESHLSYLNSKGIKVNNASVTTSHYYGVASPTDIHLRIYSSDGVYNTPLYGNSDTLSSSSSAGSKIYPARGYFIDKNGISRVGIALVYSTGFDNNVEHTNLVNIDTIFDDLNQPVLTKDEDLKNGILVYNTTTKRSENLGDVDSNGLKISGTSVTMDKASTSVYGTVKVTSGNGLDISDGTISINSDDILAGSAKKLSVGAAGSSNIPVYFTAGGTPSPVGDNSNSVILGTTSKTININGRSETSGSAEQATKDASGNVITSTYASSFDCSDNTITLKAKDGTTLSEGVINNVEHSDSSDTADSLNTNGGVGSANVPVYFTAGGTPLPVGGNDASVTLGTTSKTININGKSDSATNVVLNTHNDTENEIYIVGATTITSTEPTSTAPVYANPRVYVSNVSDKSILTSDYVNSAIVVNSYGSLNSSSYYLPMISTTNVDNKYYSNIYTSPFYVTAPYVNFNGFSFTSVGSIIASQSIIASTFNATSDKRLKENICSWPDEIKAIDFINKIKLYEYTFKSDDKKEKHIGVIAQELQELDINGFNFVSENEDGYLSVKEGKLVYLLIKAVQEQNKKIEELEEKLNKLLKE